MADGGVMEAAMFADAFAMPAAGDALVASMAIDTALAADVAFAGAGLLEATFDTALASDVAFASGGLDAISAAEAISVESATTAGAEMMGDFGGMSQVGNVTQDPFSKLGQALGKLGWKDWAQMGFGAMSAMGNLSAGAAARERNRWMQSQYMLADANAQNMAAQQKLQRTTSLYNTLSTQTNLFGRANVELTSGTPENIRASDTEAARRDYQTIDANYQNRASSISLQSAIDRSQTAMDSQRSLFGALSAIGSPAIDIARYKGIG